MSKIEADKEAPVMTRLREGTRALHREAEHHPLQRELLTGAIPRGRYVMYLEQMYLIHQALEATLRQLVQEKPALARIVEEHQYQEPYLRSDLEFWGVQTEEIRALPRTERLIEQIKRTATEKPLAVLGYHYVLEGSNNGSKYIAAGLRKTFDLPDSRGLLYLDPYGDAQRGRWQRFRETMSEPPWQPEEISELVDTAAEMFQGVIAVCGDLMSAKLPEASG